MHLIEKSDLGALLSNLIVNHLLHLLQPTKLVLHLGHLGYSQRSAFLFFEREVRQIIEKAIRIIKFEFQGCSLRDYLSRRLIVFPEYFVVRIKKTDQIDNPLYIWRLINNKIHSPQQSRNDPFVVFQTGCSISDLTQD